MRLTISGTKERRRSHGRRRRHALLEHVRAAARHAGGKQPPTREQKTAALRERKWRKVSGGKQERWANPDGTFTGTLNESFQRAVYGR
jgi:hypothetical protein